MTEVLCPVCGARCPELNPRCMSCGTPLPDGSGDGLPSFSPSSGTEPMPLLAPEGPAELRSGSQIGRFRIAGKLGRGGMGVVYRAVDLDLGREVALKFLLPRAALRPREEARFRREAQSAAALDHVNIGTIYEVGEHGGRRFIAMALYDGETLAQRLKRARGQGPPVPLAEALAIAAQLASALAAAHAAGIVHRDLKPSNVMLTGGGCLKLLDFGLARTPGDSDLTEAGVAVGTAAYMAPEQLRGERFDARTDLWALGVVLYEMLAGQHPFRAGPHGPALTQAILHEDPPPLRQVRPDVPPALAGAVERCLAKDPAGRFASAADLLSELTELQSPAAAPVTETAPRSTVPQPAAAPARTARRLAPRAGAAAMLATAAFLIAGALAAWLWQEKRAGAPLYVAVARPVVTGPLDPASHAIVAANLQTASLRALTALNGIAPLDATRDHSPESTALDVARATAAHEVLTTRADCSSPEVCQVTLQRLSGEDGRILWTDTFQSLRSWSRLFAETVGASVRKAYPGRELRLDLLELRVDESSYGEYLGLLRQSDTQSLSTDELIARAAELRLRSPSFVEAYVFEANLARNRFISTGDRQYLERGLAVASRARELAPGDPRPLASLFDLYLAVGELEAAATVLAELEGLESNPEQLLYRQARLAEGRGEPEAAVRLMREAVELRPLARYLLLLANMEYRLGRLGEARRHLEEILTKSPSDIRALQVLAQVELLEGKTERAVNLLTEVVQQTPEAGPLANLGLAEMFLGRYADAEHRFRRALTIDPGNLQYTLNLADCLLLLRRRDEARALYHDIVASDGKTDAASSWMILSLRAQAFAHLGEKQLAVAAIQEAVRITPDNPQLAMEAALVYTLVEDHTSALFYTQKAVQSGVSKIWFRYPWFDPLRGDPAFRSLTRP